jgi:hypothetical protein
LAAPLSDSRRRYSQLISFCASVLASVAGEAKRGEMTSVSSSVGEEWRRARCGNSGVAPGAVHHDHRPRNLVVPLVQRA